MRSTATLTTRLSLRGAYALGCATYIVVFLVWSAVDNVVVVSLSARSRASDSPSPTPAWLSSSDVSCRVGCRRPGRLCG